MIPIPPPGDVADVVIVRKLEQEPLQYERVWEPYIARWHDDLLVAYGRKLNSKSDMGDLECQRSTDHGKTWSEPVVVFDSNVPIGGKRYAYANAILFQPKGGDTVWCFGQRCPLHYRDSEDAELCAAYSADGGLSWQPVELAMSYESALIVVAGIRETQQNGYPHYLLPAHRNTMRHDPKGDCQQFVLESSDLLHWSLAGYVPQPEPAQVFMHEGNIAVGDKPGELKMVMRTSKYNKHEVLDPPTAYSSVSEDGGHTWSVAHAEPSLYNAISKGFYDRDSLGRHIYIYNDGPASARMGLQYVVQSTDGKWSAPRPFFDTNTHNSYPSMIEESPGVWVGAWDSATDSEHRRTAIRFGRLRVK